jgi:hypothetical protein
VCLEVCSDAFWGGFAGVQCADALLRSNRGLLPLLDAGGASALDLASDADAASVINLLRSM